MMLTGSRGEKRFYAVIRLNYNQRKPILKTLGERLMSDRYVEMVELGGEPQKCPSYY
jgi:hypothetical protein